MSSDKFDDPKRIPQLEIDRPGGVDLLMLAASQFLPGAETLGEVLGITLTRRTYKKIQDFVNDLAVQVAYNSRDVRAVTRIFENDQFQAIIWRAVEELRKTADQEKIKLLRRVVVNSCVNDVDIPHQETIVDTALSLSVPQAKMLALADGFQLGKLPLTQEDTPDLLLCGKPISTDEAKNYLTEKFADSGIPVPISIQANRLLLSNGLLEEPSGLRPFWNPSESILRITILTEMGDTVLELLRAIPSESAQ